MLAVSIDEAWGDSTLPPARPQSPPSVPSGSSHKSRRSAKRASSLAAEAEIDILACVSTLEQVSNELRDLKILFGRQQAEQKTVLYVAIGVVIMLLLFTAHSYSRLQYASDCMLHFHK